MEILANNGHSNANDGLPDTQVEDGLRENGSLEKNHSALVVADPMVDIDLEDMSMKVNIKKRAFDEEAKDLHNPSKKLASRSSSDTLIAEVDCAIISSPLTEAMNIDTTREEAGARSPSNQEIPGSFEQISGSVTTCTTVSYLSQVVGNHVNSGAASMCKSDQLAPNLQSTDVTSSSVECNIDTASSEGDLITLKSAPLEMKDMGTTVNGFSEPLGLMTEVGVEKEKDTQIIPKNGHLDFEADQITLNLTGEEGTDVVMGTDKSDDGLLFSRPSEAEDSEKMKGQFRVSSTSMGEVSVPVSEADKTPLSMGSHTAPTACQVIEESALVVDGVLLQCETTTEEEVVDGRSEISEVGELLQVQKLDATKALELKMVEIIMQSPGLEVAENRVDGITPKPSSDDPLSVVREHEDGNIKGKNIMNGLSEEYKPTEELFEPVVQLPEHLERANSFPGGTLDADDQSNGKISDDLLLQQSGSEKGDDSTDRQDSEVATPSAATSAQSQSSGLKMRLNMKGPGEMALKTSPSFSVGRIYPTKEVLLKEAPVSAKLLLASGLLDGHHVRYLGRGGHVMLTGVIQKGGVRCDCNTCKGVKVVNVSAFEKHAGSSARHPSDYIFLENGKCVKDILEIGWKANKQKLNIMDVLKSAIGEVGGETVEIRVQDRSLMQNELVEKKSRLSLETKLRGLPLDMKPRMPLDTKPKMPLDTKPRMPLDTKPRMPLDTKPRMPLDTKPRPASELKVRGNEGRAALPRDRTIKEKETPSSPVLSRETSGANLHKALFLPGGLEDDTELGYYVKGQKYLSGVKRGTGIFCSCCKQVISCSLFEQHAGWGSRRNPYTSIYLADGRSLHDAAQSLVVAVKQEGITPTKIEHLDQCVECGDTGDLQLCTGCPNAYHLDCLGSGDSSIGEFFCFNCQDQRFGGTKDRRRSVGKRRSKGAAKTLLTNDRMTNRCTRLLQALPEATSIGGCVFCKSGDFAKSGFGPMTTLLCDQCEREYHVGCLKKHGLEDLKELPEGEWFCGQDCKHIHSILSLLVANGPEPLADSIISKALKTRPQFDKSSEESALESGCGGFEWQLLHGRGGDPANGKTLSEAVEIFSECFDPIADGISGGDLIPLMVHRRTIRDQDFGGIYCVVLKHFNKVVSTALIRVFGRQLAELPLLATSPSHQGQGHCKALLMSIERLLGVLRVERLALPAAEGAEGIWLNKFAFTRMTEEQVMQFHTDLNMMIFTGSFMLEKEIAPLEISGSA